MNATAEKFLKFLNNNFALRFFLWQKMPSAFWAGVKLDYADADKAISSVPFKRMSQNPFGSTYFACLAMSAEFATGVLALLAIQGYKPGVSMLVVNLEAQFLKKATGVTRFTCEEGAQIREIVEKSKQTGEGYTYRATSIGRNDAGEEVARFYITWSFKARR